MERTELTLERVSATSRQAMICFSLSVIIFTASLFTAQLVDFSPDFKNIVFFGPALYICLFNFVLRYWFTGFEYKVAIRSSFLGAVFAIGIIMATLDHGCKYFGRYLMILSGFHFSEFMSVALTNPLTLSLDSFILNHSIEYGVAAIASWIEWLVEFFYFPEMKDYNWLSYVGVAMCIGGEIFRKAAIFTARTNFNHTVQFVRQPDHRLVTHGVYSVCRHPSYVGWFYWSIGTQITLLNPICVVFYALASWSFFRERVYAEELTLLSFFGPDYLEYQKRVGTGLPFIRGYIPEDTRQRAKDEKSY